jgi:hypothetical protein
MVDGDAVAVAASRSVFAPTVVSGVGCNRPLGRIAPMHPSGLGALFGARLLRLTASYGLDIQLTVGQ